jgi:hypothetical protein
MKKNLVLKIFLSGGYILWVLLVLSTITFLVCYYIPIFRFNLPGDYSLKYSLKDYKGTISDADSRIILQDINSFGFCSRFIYGQSFYHWSERDSSKISPAFFIIDTETGEVKYPLEHLKGTMFENKPMATVYTVSELFNGDLRRIGLNKCE